MTKNKKSSPIEVKKRVTPSVKTTPGDTNLSDATANLSYTFGPGRCAGWAIEHIFT